MNKFKSIYLTLIIFTFISINAVNAATSMKEMDMQGPDMMLKEQQTMLKKLGPADKNYDLRFLDMMIIHHQGAVDMAKDVLQKSEREELKQMAKNIISSQTKEIDQMKNWKKQWYGKPK